VIAPTALTQDDWKKEKIWQRLSEVRLYTYYSEWSSCTTIRDLFWKSEHRRFETKSFAASSSKKHPCHQDKPLALIQSKTRGVVGWEHVSCNRQQNA